MYFICRGLRSWHLIVQTQMDVRSTNSNTWSGTALSLNFYTLFSSFNSNLVWALCLSRHLFLVYMPCKDTMVTFLDLEINFKAHIISHIKNALEESNNLSSSLDWFVQTSTMLLMIIMLCLFSAEGKLLFLFFYLLLFIWIFHVISYKNLQNT